MPTPDLALTNLRTTVQNLEATFLPQSLAVRSLTSLGLPEALKLSAYVVLAHAAFEEYFEALATWGLDMAVEDWRHQRIRKSAATLILHVGKVSAVSDDTPEDRAFERVRAELDRVKKSFSNFITRDNHGISAKYLKRLFYPLGVDLPPDVRMMASLDTLAGLRGTAAHTATRGAKRQLDPNDTKKIVTDCLDLAVAMKIRVLAIT